MFLASIKEQSHLLDPRSERDPAPDRYPPQLYALDRAAIYLQGFWYPRLLRFHQIAQNVRSSNMNSHQCERALNNTPITCGRSFQVLQDGNIKEGSI